MTILGSIMLKTAAASRTKLPKAIESKFLRLGQLKLAAVSDEQARGAIDRLQTLERNKPTLRQAARYGAIGATAGPIIGAVGNVVSGRARPANVSLLRSIAGDAAKGALAAGATPLVRSHFDRQAEIGTLKNYLAEHNEHQTKAASFIDTIKNVGGRAASQLHALEDPIEVAGLAALAAPGVDNMVSRRRALKAGLGDSHGHVSDEDMDKYRLIKEKYHDPVEVGGLGVLAAPILGKHLAPRLGH